MGRSLLHYPDSLGVMLELVVLAAVVVDHAEEAVVQLVAYPTTGDDVVVAEMEVQVASLEPPMEGVEVVQREQVAEGLDHPRHPPLQP